MDNTNEHSFEGIFSQSYNPIFSLVGENQERSEVFMGGFGKFFHLKDSNSFDSITISLFVCQHLSSSRRGGVGQKSLLFFFSSNYQFEMMLFFVYFIWK